jgi:hypothetical protein
VTQSHLSKIWQCCLSLKPVLRAAAQTLFVYDTSGFYSQAVADLFVKVTIGFILSQSATNWISYPPFHAV